MPKQTAVDIIAGRYSEQQLDKVCEILIDFENELSLDGVGRNVITAFGIVEKYLEAAINTGT